MSGDGSCSVFRRVMPQVLTIEVARRAFTNFNYIVFDPRSRDAVIVDPAWEFELLAAVLDDRQLRLRGVLITHSHPDHLNLAEPFAERFDCAIWMSAAEAGYAGFHSARLRGTEQTRWKIGSLEIEALLTPGHTPGCVCYRIGDGLFTGDVLFAEGCGMCPSVDAAHQMYDSLERIKRWIGPDTRIYPGHSYGRAPGQRFATVLSENIYLQFSDADSFVAFRMRRNQSLAKALQFASAV